MQAQTILQIAVRLLYLGLGVWLFVDFVERARQSNFDKEGKRAIKRLIWSLCTLLLYVFGSLIIDRIFL